MPLAMVRQNKAGLDRCESAALSSNTEGIYLCNCSIFLPEMLLELKASTISCSPLRLPPQAELECRLLPLRTPLLAACVPELPSLEPPPAVPLDCWPCAAVATPVVVLLTTTALFLPWKGPGAVVTAPATAKTAAASYLSSDPGVRCLGEEGIANGGEGLGPVTAGTHARGASEAPAL